jgi:adenosylcobyric acid synthase
MARTLIVWGCSSGAGKSWLATALCRAAARRGIDVAPFKAQNMSNNARVVPAPDGGHGEIGTAQYLQARAARVAPSVDMNPVLLKPEHDTGSQVVVHGTVRADLSRTGWIERNATLAAAARESFLRLAAAHALVIVEGAGSPAEINLAPHDFVNLGTARWARDAGPTQALLVADIDRGGAFAHLHGTTLLLPADLRPLLAGHVLNRFRGDAALLEPGPAQLQALTGVPLAAVIPMVADHGLPEEDGWSGSAVADVATTVPATAALPRASGAGPMPRLRTVAVIAPPRISNLDEFAPLVGVSGLRLIWARTAADLATADLVVLPGSKQVSGDLAWLRARGLGDALLAHAAAGGAVLGVCGGLQMLGRHLDDPHGHDGEPGCIEGLGLLPLVTRYDALKRVRPGRFTFASLDGVWQPLSGQVAEGYEIRHGHTKAYDDARCTVVLHDGAGEPIGWQAGSVLGVYAHGLLESAAVVHALFGAGSRSLEASLDTLADTVEAAFGASGLERLLGA